MLNTVVDFPPRVPALVRMLASDQDGEVIGAARALGRVLRNAGLSFHDLAERIEAPAYANVSTHAPPQRPTQACTWKELDSFSQIDALHYLKRHPALTDWEQDFAASIIGLRARGRVLHSPKQILVLDRLLGKAFAWEAARS